VIPEEYRPAVTRGLQSAFGTDEYDEILTPSGGLSPSLVYRIVVRGRPYLLRIISERAWGDPSREFAAMQAGSDAGIAPRILYSSFEDRLLLTDFIEVRPYPEDMAMRMAHDFARCTGCRRSPARHGATTWEPWTALSAASRLPMFCPAISPTICS
jgi:hypothetical protein